MKTFETLRVIVLILGLFIIGWLSNTAYRDYNYHREYNGLWIPNIQNDTSAFEISRSYDSLGNWVCINVREMEYPEAYNTCVHECSHQAYSEIFAGSCTKNMSKCMEVLK